MHIRHKKKEPTFVFYVLYVPFVAYSAFGIICPSGVMMAW